MDIWFGNPILYILYILIGGYPDSSARLTRDPATGNSLFGSRAVLGSIPAELTKHPMVRYNNVMAPTEERYREILERLADSSHRNDIQFGTEPNRYNGAQHAGLEFGMTESMPERSGRPEGLEFGESERGTNPTLGDRTGSATCPPRHDSEPVVFVTSTPELVVRQSKPLFDVVKETTGMSSIITSPDSAYVSRPVEPDTTELRMRPASTRPRAKSNL